jgi:hypothetical protein
MNTDHQRSYELEPIVIGRGLDEFAGEGQPPPSTLEIEDLSRTQPAALGAFESEVAVAPAVPVAPLVPMVPVSSVAPTVSLRSSAAVRSARQRWRPAISSAASMLAVAASVVAAWTVAWVSTAIVLISRRIESSRTRRRTAWRPLGLQWLRASALSAASMIAVAASVVAAWIAAWVSTAIVLISRMIESSRARRRTVSKPLDRQWLGASALSYRRSTIAAFSVALLAIVLLPPWTPPAVSPVNAVSSPVAAVSSPVVAVSTSTSPPASIPTVDVADARTSDPPPVARQVTRLPAIPPLKAIAPPKPPVAQATPRTAAASAGPVAQKPLLLAVNNGDIRETIAAHSPPAPATIERPAAEEPKLVAPEPAAYSAPVIAAALGTVAADRVAIDDVLAAYRQSFNSLDASAVSAIWRGADTRALARAFSALTRQHITFDRCDVRVTAADRARARCDGILSYVQKAGDTTPQRRRVSWSIDLGQPDDRWVIVGVQAR